MTIGVWVESPGDGGSAVWGCSTCERGHWCSDHTSAALEARMHARSHGPGTAVTTVDWRRGPKPKRDTKIAKLREQGHTIRAIAVAVRMSNSGVIKALRRIKGVRSSDAPTGDVSPADPTGDLSSTEGIR